MCGSLLECKIVYTRYPGGKICVRGQCCRPRSVLSPSVGGHPLHNDHLRTRTTPTALPEKYVGEGRGLVFVLVIRCCFRFGQETMRAIVTLRNVEGAMNDYTHPHTRYYLNSEMRFVHKHLLVRNRTGRCAARLHLNTN